MAGEENGERHELNQPLDRQRHSGPLDFARGARVMPAMGAPCGRLVVRSASWQKADCCWAASHWQRGQEQSECGEGERAARPTSSPSCCCRWRGRKGEGRRRRAEVEGSHAGSVSGQDVLQEQLGRG